MSESLQPKVLRQNKFLRAFARIGVITRAAQEAGITRKDHYLWLAEDSDYKTKFREVLENEVPNVLEEEVHRRGVAGWLEPVFHKGKVVGTTRRYSDTLLIFATKAALPDKYRERTDVNHTGEVVIAKRLIGVPLDEV